MNLAITIFGTLAAICMVLGYLPQAIYTIRTRDTDGIALPTFLLMGAGSIFFVIQGCFLANWPLVITNVITAVCSSIVFGIKMYNDYFSPRARERKAKREKVTSNMQQNSYMSKVQSSAIAPKSKTATVLLAFFVGGIGIHRFYLGQKGLGIAYLLFSWTLVPAIIGLVDFVCFLCQSDEKFNLKYNTQH